MDEKDLIVILKKESKIFKELEEDHKKIETRLNKLLKRKHLTPAEEIEKRTLQKEKLLKKDKMEKVLHSYKENISEGL